MGTWVQSTGSACYSGSAGTLLIQEGAMVVGEFYFVKITVENMTQGKLTIQSLSGYPEITANGEYEYLLESTFGDLIINPGTLGAGVFNGCITQIELSLIPTYRIKDLDGITISTMSSNTGLTADRIYIQYQLDWTLLQDGCYYIEFSDVVLTYMSDCFSVKLTHDCTITVEWYNDQDGFGFNYSGLTFRPQLRLDGKVWKPRFTTEDKEVYGKSNGNKLITYARVYEELEVAIKEAPDYVHRAIAVAINHDNLFVNDIASVVEDEEYTPTWRNSSNLAPSAFIVKQNRQDLLNSNC